MNLDIHSIDTFDEFFDYMSKTILSATKSIEQIIQYESKYFRADNNLFRYNLQLLSDNSLCITKKLYIILRNKEDSRSDNYRDYIAPYQENGFNIKPIYLCEMESKNNIELNDLILIDNTLCITAETQKKSKHIYQNEVTTTYHIDSNISNYSKIKKTRHLLKSLRIENFRQNNSLRIYEPLSESADINYEFALLYCKNGVMSSGDCTWYHSVWQYLRIIDKVSSPEWHSAFYENCFEKLMKKKNTPKVLISGTADYSLLAYVYHSSKKLKKNAEIFVLDTCKTPLKICEWYAEKQGFKITVLNMSVFDLPKLNKQFDLICCDAFLTRFSEDDANRVVANWYNALTRKGVVVTTVRTREDSDICENNYQREKYINDCINRFQKWEGYFNISLKDFTDMVVKYVNNMKSNNLGNKTSISYIFTKNGFRIDDISAISDTPGELLETSYYEICCRKE